LIYENKKRSTLLLLAEKKKVHFNMFGFQLTLTFDRNQRYLGTGKPGFDCAFSASKAFSTLACDLGVSASPKEPNALLKTLF
jgi:hypothetical protein